MTGAAGEYFVAAELSRRGWLATVTIKNAPGTDVLAHDPANKTVVAIQTKTASGSRFQLDRKCERPTTAHNEWFVFVELHDSRTRPSFYVVPRNIVAGAVFADHQEWLSRPARDGSPHNDNSRRNLLARYLTGYEDPWDLLDRPADEAPLLIDDWYGDCVKRFGLPDGHPGWPTAA